MREQQESPAQQPAKPKTIKPNRCSKEHPLEALWRLWNADF
jgi:hypothetical protein